MDGNIDDVEITLDCAVESDYEVLLLTGDPHAENSFENPENVHDTALTLTGASADIRISCAQLFD